MEEPAEAMLDNLLLDNTTKKMMDNMTEWENLGQSVIMGKRAMIELDERRQKCREALGQLRKQAKNTTNKRWGKGCNVMSGIEKKTSDLWHK
ncbi:unnamed protein product [Onchocerca flexuosa]|uniref:Reverse transcriptase domain-containing protein n=1 Tax=Onchocerca flexuosa TaxID=387005 RepID=A0A183I5J2_9BILA|nr:unnamed protein product [Onchocerca flexuosa]